MIYYILALFFWVIYGYLITVYLEQNDLSEKEALFVGVMVGGCAALLWPAKIVAAWVYIVLKIIKKNEFIKKTSKRIVGCFE